jgi:organic hydroperoxide reductase OsmC/OhrA
MKISAGVTNSEGQHQVTMRTNENVQSIVIPPKSTGFGSSVNGGELLFLALATCFCNDLYREAGKKGIKVQKVEVEVGGDFGGEGDPATNVTYRAKVTAQASEEDIRALINQTDRLTEIQNKLRTGTPVVLTGIEAVSV